MNCFPMMVRLEGRRVLLVGGGKVALRKAEALTAFGAKIEVCAPRPVPALEALASRVYPAYEPRLLTGLAFAVAATDDKIFNARVAADCRKAGVPVNSVDAPVDCDFYFPALLTRGDVTVAVSTGGAAPALAAALKGYLARCLPEELEEICARAAALRHTMPAEEYLAAVQRLLEEGL